MKKCINCNTLNEIDSNFCVNCGNSLDNAELYSSTKQKVNSSVPTWLIVVCIIFGIIFLGVIIDDDTKNNKSDTDNNKPIIDTSKEETQNNIVPNTQTKEKFSYEISSEYKSSFTYYIEGVVTNNRNKNYSYVSIEFVCYDSNGNNIGTAWDNTNNLLANENWKFKAMLLSTENDVSYCKFLEISGW